MKVGCDTSHYQSVDLDAYDGDWIAFKATQGIGFTDPVFAARWKAAGQRGIPRIAYHFAEPGRLSGDQLVHFLAVVRAAGWKQGDAWALDLEQSDGTSAAHLVAFATAWVTNCRAALGGRGLFYTYGNFWRSDMGRPAAVPGGALLWWAQYTTPVNAPLGNPPPVWQYTDSASVPGVSGTCDRNKMTDQAFAELFGGEQDMPLTDADLDAIVGRMTTLLRIAFAGGADKTVRGWAAQLDHVADLQLDYQAALLAAVAAVKLDPAALGQAVANSLVGAGVVLPAQVDYVKVGEAMQAALEQVTINLTGGVEPPVPPSRAVQDVNLP